MRVVRNNMYFNQWDGVFKKEWRCGNRTTLLIKHKNAYETPARQRVVDKKRLDYWHIFIKVIKLLLYHNYIWRHTNRIRLHLYFLSLVGMNFFFPISKFVLSKVAHTLSLSLLFLKKKRRKKHDPIDKRRSKTHILNVRCSHKSS